MFELGPAPRGSRSSASATDRLSAALRNDERTRRIGRWALAAIVAAGLALTAAVLTLPRRDEPRRIEFGQWRGLLDQEPTRLHWSNNLAPPDWRPKRLEVLLPPDGDLGILGLGVIPPGVNYRFRVTIWQPHWTGNVGIVFGFQQTDVDGEPGVKYQAIALERAGDGGGLRLSRFQTVRVHKGAGRMLPPIPTQLTLVPRQHEETLEIEVHRNHVMHVRFGREDLTELCKEQVNAQFRDEDYVGGIGVWSHNNMAVFRDAQVMYLER